MLSGIGGLAIPDWLTASPAKGLEKQTETGQQYDLTGLSGDAWRYARIVVYVCLSHCSKLLQCLLRLDNSCCLALVG